MTDYRDDISNLIDSLSESNRVTDGQRTSLLNALMRVGRGEFLSVNPDNEGTEDEEETIYKLHVHINKMTYSRVDNQVIIDPKNIDFDYYTPLTVSDYDMIRDTIYHDGYFEFNIESNECEWFTVGDLFNSKEIHTILPSAEFTKGIIFEQDRQLVRIYHITEHSN